MEELTNWERLFGTTERAAETLFAVTSNCSKSEAPCESCPAFPKCNWEFDDMERSKTAMLEWLEGGSE